MAGPAAPKPRKETDALGTLLDKMIAQFQRTDAQIQFIGEPFAPPASDLEVDVPVEVTDAVGVREALTAVSRVRMNIVGGTAPGAQLRQGNALSPIDGSLDISMVEGRGIVEVIATGTGTVDLTLTDIGGSGLDVSDVAVVTFS